MKYAVLLTQDAERDLEEIYDYIFDRDSPARADYVVGEIEKAFRKLTTFPERGSYPLELIAHGITEYREIRFKPYRIVYKIADRKVYVMLIADGRRHLEPLLLRRLLN